MLDIHHLPNMEADEELVFFLRRHPITLTSLVLGYILILAIPFIASWFVTTVTPDLWASPLLRPLIILGGSIFFLFAWLFLFQSFLDYYLDMWIVTNKRILNIEQTGLFHRTISELRLYRIQDVTSEIKGMLSTMLDFGDVKIQTAGEQERFDFEEVPHPNHIAKIILENAEEDRKHQIDVALEDNDMLGSPHEKKVETKKTGL